jgi:hypothetical protein
VKLLDRLARGEKPNELNRRLKTGTVLVREYNGERHTVTVVPEAFCGETWPIPVSRLSHKRLPVRSGMVRVSSGCWSLAIQTTPTWQKIP